MDKREGGSRDIPSKKLCLTVPEKSRRGIVFCCIFFGYCKSLDKKGGGVSRFPVDNFLSHSAENFRRGILYCCLNFGYREGLDKMEGENQVIPSKKLCLTELEKFRRGILYCCSNFGYLKSLDKKGGISRFSVEIFCLTVPKFFVGESYTVALVSSIDKVWIRRVGVSRSSVENFLPHSAEKLRTGTLYCCINFRYRKNLEEREWGGVSRFPVDNFLSRSAENLPTKIL